MFGLVNLRSPVFVSWCSRTESNRDRCGELDSGGSVNGLHKTQNRADLLANLMALEEVAQGWPLPPRSGERAGGVACALVSRGARRRRIHVSKVFTQGQEPRRLAFHSQFAGRQMLQGKYLQMGKLSPRR